MVEPIPSLTPTVPRADALEALAATRFDLLVIGGGIVGAATAAHAARAGLSVALVDARDFGGATSSASSKLIHGGLRYLRMGDVRLVREAHHERRVLAGVVAPHLVHRMPFLFPLYEGGPYRPAFVQSGILLYSALATSRLNWLVDPSRAQAAVPSLRTEGLRSCAHYADAWTNDARLCLENVRAAADAGAVVLNQAEVVALRLAAQRVVGAEVNVDGSVDLRRREDGHQRRRAMGRHRAAARGSECRNVGAPEQGCACPRAAHRALADRSHDRPGSGAGDLRRPVVRDAAAGDNRHGVRRRPPHRRGRAARCGDHPPRGLRRPRSRLATKLLVRDGVVRRPSRLAGR